MIKLFSDGADEQGIMEAANNPKVSGFTTNPTLMRQAGVSDYERFAKNVISKLYEKRPETSLSLEVFDDTMEGIFAQAMVINSWSQKYDVYVKIPVTNTKGESTAKVVRELSNRGVKCNVTAVFTLDQANEILEALNPLTPSIVSVFSGRIADTGRNAVTLTRQISALRKQSKYVDYNVEILWASSRQAYAYNEAIEAGCDIITMPIDLIKKVDKFGKDLAEFSLDTVKMFYNDALSSGFTISV
jgi:transaldolase